MVPATCLVSFISTVNGLSNKKRKEKKKLTLGRPALVAGTQQTLSNLFWRLLISMGITYIAKVSTKQDMSL
jgi:hypothetical protein